MNENKPMLSIIIPVYNVENYLKQCIDSVLAQNYNNIEIILVDDGSTDSSGSICDEYAEKDKRIKVIHKKNEGQFIARQTGLELSTGDFCIFLDSDDYWEPYLIKKLQYIINKYQCDMIIFNKKDVFENTVIEGQLPFHNECVFIGEKKEELYKMLLEGGKLNNLVLKVFKRSLSKDNIENYGFKGICYGEDAFKSACLIKEAKKIVYLSDCLYNYRKGVGITSHITADLIEKVAFANSCMLKLLKDCTLDFENYRKRNMINYMKYAVRFIIYGYIDNPEMLKKVIENVTETDYYQEAKRVSKAELNFFEKIIIHNAEKQKYCFIRFVSIALKLKNMFRKNF